MTRKCQKNRGKNKTVKHSENLFSVQDIENRGKGLISTQTIKFGEIILKETPLLIIKNSESSNFEEWAQNVVNLVKELPQEKQEKYLNLADNEFFNSCPEFQYLKSVKKFRLNCAQVYSCLKLLFHKTIL